MRGLKMELEVFDFEQVEPIQNHHGFDQISFQVDMTEIQNVELAPMIIIKKDVE